MFSKPKFKVDGEGLWVLKWNNKYHKIEPSDILCVKAYALMYPSLVIFMKNRKRYSIYAGDLAYLPAAKYLAEKFDPDIICSSGHQYNLLYRTGSYVVLFVAMIALIIVIIGVVFFGWMGK